MEEGRRKGEKLNIFLGYEEFHIKRVPFLLP